MKLPNGWQRDFKEEGGNVLRWYKKPSEGIIASLVKGDITNEGEWRISGHEFDTIEVRGDMYLMLKRSDLQNIRILDTLIRREKMK
jgi:hypothetical protein